MSNLWKSFELAHIRIYERQIDKKKSVIYVNMSKLFYQPELRAIGYVSNISPFIILQAEM